MDKDRKKQGDARPKDKLDALRIALQRTDNPSNKFMRAFESMMRKDKDEEQGRKD